MQDARGTLGRLHLERLLRREDPALLTGEAKFTDDLNIPGALHLAVLRSPYAHARILSVDLDAARALPGVVGALMALEVAVLSLIPARMSLHFSPVSQ